MTYFFGRSYVVYVLAAMLSLCSIQLYANTSLLSPQDAFSFSVESVDTKTARLEWKIQPNYYLYQHKFNVRQNNQPLTLKLPEAVEQHDDNFGKSQVYYQSVQFKIATQPLQTYHVTWQGCAKDRICYPPQNIEFKTDQDGLVELENTAITRKTLLDVARENQSAPLSASEQTRPQDENTDSDVAQDQFWTSKLEQHSLGYAVILFLGLGILLAFTPCSLPMLPILTSLIVRDRQGIRAWLIALTFVCSMALVYAVLGLVASSAGLNFQRWLQQPVTLVAFSGLFIVFALNLFGLFEIKVPQTLTNRLDRIQSMQRGGTLLGAAVMGIISALLVGPCMTAPLAGTLLFISQTQDQFQGAILLFCLGFGMGIPLLLAAFLGTKILPKAGQWMHQIKIIFAFIMLALAIYFIRPLLSDWIVQLLSLLLGLTVIAYAAYRLYKYPSQLKWLYVVILALVTLLLTWNQYQHIQRWQSDQHQAQANWHIATTAAEFEHYLAQAPRGQAIVVDVYADWCVACQPIEHQILKQEIVQQKLKPFYLIKLDLSQYDQSHQQLLNQWEILGPPTYLFLNEQHREIRHLRLTGAFTQAQLLTQLNQL